MLCEVHLGQSPRRCPRLDVRYGRIKPQELSIRHLLGPSFPSPTVSWTQTPGASTCSSWGLELVLNSPSALHFLVSNLSHPVHPASPSPGPAAMAKAIPSQSTEEQESRDHLQES